MIPMQMSSHNVLMSNPNQPIHHHHHIYIGSSLGSINTSLTATCSGCFNAYTMLFATSSGSSIAAPDGSPYSFTASRSVLMLSRSVAVLPGCTLVTLRPFPAVSRRRDCSVASTKNLDALYTPKPGKTFLPASEERATICPPPRSSIGGTVAERQCRSPLQLTSTVWSQAGMLISGFDIRLKYITPAQETRMSTGPSSVSAVCIRASTSSFLVTSVRLVMTLPSRTTRRRLTLSSASVAARGERDVTAFSGQSDGDSGADSGRRAGDDCDFAGEDAFPRRLSSATEREL